MMARTEDGRAITILTLIDEYTRESLAIYAARRIRAHDVIELLADVMTARGIPEPLRRFMARYYSRKWTAMQKKPAVGWSRLVTLL